MFWIGVLWGVCSTMVIEFVALIALAACRLKGGKK